MSFGATLSRSAPFVSLAQGAGLANSLFAADGCCVVELTLAGWRTNAYITRINKEVRWSVHYLYRARLYEVNGWNVSRAMSKDIPRVIVTAGDAAHVEMQLRECFAARLAARLDGRRAEVPLLVREVQSGPTS